VSRLTRWGIVVATAATGLFGFLLARPVTTSAHVATSAGTDDQGGESVGVTPTTAGSATAPAAGKTKSKTPTTQQQLQAPVQQPQRSNRHTQTTTGGS